MKKQLKPLITLTLLHSISTFITEVHPDRDRFHLKDFRDQYFKIKKMNLGMYEIDIGLKNPKNLNSNKTSSKKIIDNFWVIGYADLNSDNKVDIIALDQNLKNLLIFHYNDTLSTYENTKNIPVIEENSDEIISDAMVADMDNDGYPDIICFISKRSEKSISKIKFVFQDEFGFKESLNKNQAEFGDFGKHHPQPFQIYDKELEELKTYLIFQKNDTERKVISFEKDFESIHNIVHIVEKNWLEFISKKEGCINIETIKNKKISDKNAGAFIDLNMDCRPDLVVESEGEGRFMEIYFYTDDGFCLIDVNKVPEEFSSGAFFNINSDGSNDVLFLNKRLEFFIFFNEYHLVEENAMREFCRKDRDGDRKKPFTSFEGEGRNSNKFYTFTFENSNQYELTTPENCTLCRNVIRHTDLNYDTYEDLVINVKKKSDGKNYDLFLKNVPCTKSQYIDFNVLFSDKSFENCRYFSKKSGEKYFNKLNNEPSYYSSFIDFGEMGNMGLLRVTDQNNKPKIKAYFNYITQGQYFFKVSPKTKDPLTSHGKSSHCIGCSLQAIETDGYGEKERPFIGTVSYGSHFMRLQLPYKIFGLGRTTNFIHYFSLGVSKDRHWWKEWTPLIPNSHVVVYAFGEDSEGWKIKLFLNPSRAMKIIAAMTGVILILLVLCVVCLKFKEKQEDDEDPDIVKKYDEHEFFD